MIIATILKIYWSLNTFTLIFQKCCLKLKRHRIETKNVMLGEWLKTEESNKVKGVPLKNSTLVPTTIFFF